MEFIQTCDLYEFYFTMRTYSKFEMGFWPTTTLDGGHLTEELYKLGVKVTGVWATRKWCLILVVPQMLDRITQDYPSDTSFLPAKKNACEAWGSFYLDGDTRCEGVWFSVEPVAQQPETHNPYRSW